MLLIKTQFSTLALTLLVTLFTSPLIPLLPETEAITAIMLGEAQPAPSPPDQPGDPRPPKLPGQIAGSWSGIVHTHREDIPFTLRIDESGDIHARLGKQLWTLVDLATFDKEILKGEMTGDVGTEEANRRPYTLHLALKLRGKILNGRVTAISLPGKRVGNALSYWAELKHDGNPNDLKP